RDLHEIYEFVAEHDSGTVAAQLLDKLEAQCAGLAELPNRGNIPKELREIGLTEYRELHCLVYRIIYRVIGRQVLISCVLDGRRDMQTLLQRRLLR
ncbi:MAG TPA: type II toxin-antitoxin system RelE/ParE family toxin, partial [Kiloniellales bacterium]|nr:type II toxin-antitoxin system RelE/ParE family toxin [Kiloniellales bacterium]